MAPAMVIRRVAAWALVALIATALPSAAEPAADLRLRAALELRDQNRLRESIAILEDLRHADPSNIRVARLEAETRAWAGQIHRARSLYSDLAARGDIISRLGLAQMDAWRGNLPAAANNYESLAEIPETHARALLGLARVRTWQGRTSEAARLLQDAEALGPTGSEGARARAEIRRERATRGLAVGSIQSDSDGNDWVLAGGGLTGIAGGDVRAEATFLAGSVEDQDEKIDLRRGEVAIQGAVGGIWSAGLRAGVEARDPGTGGTTKRLLGSAFVRADGGLWRLTFGGAVEPLSETPELVRSDIQLNSGNIETGWFPADWLGAEAGASFGRFSDDNERTSVRTALRMRHPEVRLHPSVGYIHRSFWMKEGAPGRSYFSPDRYRSNEAELRFDDAFWARRLRWSVRGTIGTQRVAGRPLDTVRSVSIDLDFRPASAIFISLGAGRSDVAADSPSGYRLDRATLRTGVDF